MWPQSPGCLLLCHLGGWLKTVLYETLPFLHKVFGQSSEAHGPWDSPHISWFLPESAPRGLPGPDTACCAVSLWLRSLLLRPQGGEPLATARHRKGSVFQAISASHSCFRISSCPDASKQMTRHHRSPGHHQDREWGAGVQPRSGSWWGVSWRHYYSMIEDSQLCLKLALSRASDR